MASPLQLSPLRSRTSFQPCVPPLWNAPPALRLWHLASLDAPTVSLVWSWAFAWAVCVRLPLWAPAVLALIAWAIYIADRLLDARAGMQCPPLHRLRERHRFHWKYRRILAPAAALAASAAAALVMFRLPAGARIPDSALAAATLAYFSGVHSRGNAWRLLERMLSPLSSRPFVIGVLFTAACLLPAASQATPAALPAQLRELAPVFLGFASLAWLNCQAIGAWEADSPNHGRNGIARKAAAIAAGLLAAALASGAVDARLAVLLAAGAASALLLLLLDRARLRMSPLALRAAADLALLTPAVLLPFAR